MEARLFLVLSLLSVSVYSEETCGKQSIVSQNHPLFHNKEGISQYGEFPWMVEILKKEILDGRPLQLYTCGGSIISKNVILTGAICIEDQTASTLVARVGEWDVPNKNEIYPFVDHEIEKIVIHEQFNAEDLRNNIALMFLKNDIQFNDKINTICLPPKNYSFDGKRCLVSGWGINKFGKEGKYLNVLKRIEVPIVAHAKCQKILRNSLHNSGLSLHETLMCAGGEEGKGVCPGDDGSPLICRLDENSNQYYQAGIVSEGFGCGSKDVPGIFTNVALYRDWIDKTISENTQS